MTQAFNTTTSMGRLTLNVLLRSPSSSARSAPSASATRSPPRRPRACGWVAPCLSVTMRLTRSWSSTPLRRRRSKLSSAKFVEARSVPATLRWAQAQDLRTKVRQRCGKTVGGASFHYGALRCVLSNRTYVGEVDHKGKIHQGQQEPIVQRELFDQAQAILASLSSEAMRRPRLVSASLLQGLIVDRHGRTMGSRPHDPQRATVPLLCHPSKDRRRRRSRSLPARRRRARSTLHQPARR